jgi:uncharacterized protein
LLFEGGHLGTGRGCLAGHERGVSDVTNHYVDTYQLARSGQRLQGTMLLQDCKRLTEGLPDQGDARASWVLSGETDAQGRRYLELHVAAQPVLTCQRCLGDMVWSIDSENRLQLAGSEDELERLDAQDEASGAVTDRIVGSERLDVLALVEDELILGLPYVPRHDICPASEHRRQEPDEAASRRPSPFAALGRLKKD